nr:immunoglobulin light chain junction region [Macaca mulatta]
CHQERNWPRTF